MAAKRLKTIKKRSKLKRGCDHAWLVYMKNLLRNRKAISALLIEVILVGVAIGAAVMVAAWQLGLLPGFQNVAQATIWDVAFNSGTPHNVTITVRNLGATKVTITSLKINDVSYTTTPALPQTIDANSETTLDASLVWVAGNTYRFEIRTSGYGLPITSEVVAPG